MAWTQPTVSEFKAYFFRDFPYAPADAQNDLNKVVDLDIEKAIAQAVACFNSGLGYGTDANTTIAFLFLAAHWLVMDIRMSGQGLASTGEFAISSKSAGNVSVSYEVPALYRDNAYIQGFTQTKYGQKFLQLSLPLLAGAGARVTFGTTTPLPWGAE